MHAGKTFSDKQIKQRHSDFYGDKKVLTSGQIVKYRDKWEDLSEYMKDIKQTFSRYYNKKNNRKGFFWAERFNSVLAENGETLINCLAYIDLNSVRAGIVEKPEAYRWSSLGYHIQTGNKDNWLSLDFGLKEFGVKNVKERLYRYKKFVYETGAVDAGKGAKIKAEIVEAERIKDFKITRGDLFRQRTRYFSDSGIIGSKEFVIINFKRFKHLFQCRHDKKPKEIKGLEGMYSMKRLSEKA